MSGSLADRIRAERDRQFVGRSEELDLFERLIEPAVSPVVAVHVHGPGGVGKTTLLRQFEALCVRRSIGFTTIDARIVQPTPESFLSILCMVTRQATPEGAIHAVGISPNRVLFIDTYEAIEPLDGWLRDVFAPQLPENVLLVILGRKRPAHGWRSDGWQGLTRAIPLRNLSDDDVRLFLRAQDVPDVQHAAIVKLTHGYPLALCLVADNYAQSGELNILRGSSPDVLALLLERFLEGVATREQRELLELCALVRTTTEALISEVLGPDRASDLFAWLRGLSFVEETPFGLMPHDLARDTIAGELKWRNPDMYSELHHRARGYYVDRLERAVGPAQQAILFDYIYLHRDSPMMQPFFQWNASPGAFVDQANLGDRLAIVEMVRRHEGDGSAQLAAYWFDRQPSAFIAIRDAQGTAGLVGFLAVLSLEELDDDQVPDPAVSSALTILRGSNPLRVGERALYFRFWMSDLDYQSVSPIQSLIFIAIVQHYFTVPGLAVSMLALSAPDFWAPMFGYALHRRATEADFVVGNEAYGVYFIDWRALPPKTWLDRLSEQETPIKQRAEGPRRFPEVVVLSREGFADSVQEALKSFSNLGRLSESPLLDSRLVVERAKGDADLKTKVELLRGLIVDAAQTLNTNQKDAKLYKALEAGYLKPKRSQERAAEVLDVSIATFRRHLRSASERLTGVLWQQETGN